MVIGAGYAGVMAANRLAGDGVAVTVVTRLPHFVERVRLHRVASGHRPHARVPLERVLHPAAHVIVDMAEHVDAENRQVRLASGGVLGYDWLVLAVGSSRIPGVKGVHRVASEESATRLNEALRRDPDAPVTVVGAGLTGVETACALSTAGRTVEVVTRDLLDSGPAQRAHDRRLGRLGVAIRRGTYEDVDAGGGIVVDTTGFHVPALAAASGLPTDDAGRLLVGADLCVPGRPEIVGAGDAVRVSGPGAAHLRMSCATALPMGTHAARTVTALRSGHPAAQFDHAYAIQCVDLGGRVGRVQFVTARDEPRRIALTSIVGGLAKEAVVRGTVLAMRRAARARPRREEHR